jgi:hypothetical protein
VIYHRDSYRRGRTLRDRSELSNSGIENLYNRLMIDCKFQAIMKLR